MGDKRRRFDPDFRAGAVRIVAETGKPVAQVGRDLGLSEALCWVSLTCDMGVVRAVMRVVEVVISGSSST